jgi:hypothetical protein
MDRIESTNSKINKRNLILNKPELTSDILNIPKNYGIINYKKLKTLFVKEKEKE